jgi:hypothetical protein
MFSCSSKKNLNEGLTFWTRGAIFNYKLKHREELAMYVLHVLNSAGEEEFITRKFKTKFAAVKFFHKHLYMFNAYTVTKI